MMGSKKHQISVKVNAMEPIHVSKEQFTTKYKPTFKRYQQIEEVAGRPVEDILLENIQLKNRRNDMGVQIEKLNETIEKVTDILHQLLDIELTMNPKIAKPIADSFSVNKHNEYARENINDTLSVANALRKIRYYHHPMVEEWVETVKRAKEQSVNFYRKNVELKGEVKSLQEKLSEIEQEKQEKMRQLSGKGIKILVNHKEQEAQIEENIPKIDGDEITYPVEDENEIVEVSFEDAIEETESFEESIEEDTPYQKEEISIEEPKPLETVQKESKKHNVTYYEPDESDKELIDELQKPKIKMLLDRKGYDYKDSKEPEFDLVIRDKDKEIPLVYIDFTVQKPEAFSEIMKKTDQIYFLFDTKENLKTANIKFASWLMKNARQKRKSIYFSFTAVDELKVSGLDELGTIS